MVAITGGDVVGGGLTVRGSSASAHEEPSQDEHDQTHGEMLARRLIERKRDGGRIEPGEWRALASAYARGHVPDYQMSALLMACFIRGLDRVETAALTEAMLMSGDRLDLKRVEKPRIDKHSTGGVGDKVSLVLAPLIASLGVAVPMMSGR